MVKSRNKKKAPSEENSRRTSGQQTKAAEYVGCLMELHKLQGALLNYLKRAL